MKLKKLILKNFKGVKSFELDTEEKDVDIFGDNSTGKSTLFDGVTWLLFGKDSLNSANFDIKTLRTDGQPIHNLEHSVEGVFKNGDGSEMALRKVYYEKYTKKRGTASKEFTGHNCDHFIDGVPVTMAEYKKQIQDICDENLFKLLSNPRYFNDTLHWKDRREMLLEVCGDITDEDVINSNDELADLPAILQKRKLEDHKKVIVSRRAEINKELDRIPVRIDEISSSAVKTRDKAEIEKDLSGANEEKETAQGVLKEIKAGGESEVLVTKLREVENKISQIDNEIAQKELTNSQKRRAERIKLTNEIDDIQNYIDLNKKDLQHLVSDKNETIKGIESFSKQAGQLRQKWHDEDDRQFEYKDMTTCPSCGQSLPADKVEAARKQALATFNGIKAQSLQSINNDGKKLVEQIEFSKNRIMGIDEKIESVEKKAVDLNDQKAKAEAALKDFDEQKTAEPDNPERNALIEKKEKIEKQIQEKKGSVDPAAIAEGEAQIEAIDIRIKAYEKELMQIEANARIDVRVKELSDQERTLSAEFEDLERQLYLADQFVRTKVKLLESKINSKFDLAKFQLFTVNINGGLEECCNTTYNGVPYNSLNFGMRLNCGIDITNTLSKHFGKEIFMILDNAESVTDILPSERQQIRLIVSAEDKELRIV